MEQVYRKHMAVDVSQNSPGHPSQSPFPRAGTGSWTDRPAVCMLTGCLERIWIKGGSRSALLPPVVRPTGSRSCLWCPEACGVGAERFFLKPTDCADHAVEPNRSEKSAPFLLGSGCRLQYPALPTPASLSKALASAPCSLQLLSAQAPDDVLCWSWLAF